jgi:hypothetical protein
VAFDPIFAAAYIDGGIAHKVLGARLRPFCAWHLYQLQIIDSPFLSSGQVFLYHLRRAVGICRLQFPNSRTRLPIFPLVINQAKLEREVEKFLAYVGTYLQRPEYNIIQPDEFNRGRRPARIPANAPEPVQLAFDAAHGANISLADAWNLPIGQAYIAQAMQMRRQGLMVDFMNEKERDFQESILEHMRKNRNGDTHASSTSKS